MRTAEEYAEIYNNSEDKRKAIGRIGAMFLQETSREISQAITSTGAAITEEVPVEITRAILREQNEKWRRFAKLVGVVRPEGFEILLQRESPMLFSILTKGVCQ